MSRQLTSSLLDLAYLSEAIENTKSIGSAARLTARTASWHIAPTWSSVGGAVVGATRFGCSGPVSQPTAPLWQLGAKTVPDWVYYQPNNLWIYDGTHFPRAEMAARVVEDLASRK
jgi:hypothetical protein